LNLDPGREGCNTSSSVQGFLLQRAVFGSVERSLSISSLLHPPFKGIMNPSHWRFSFSPELLYTGIKNIELRLKATGLFGEKETEFGEKQNDYRVELRVRYYF
jgi:hypothetical protein